jgi:hypothetical protein
MQGHLPCRVIFVSHLERCMPEFGRDLAHRQVLFLGRRLTNLVARILIDNTLIALFVELNGYSDMRGVE